MHWFYHCLRHYRNHEGRASRKEFWSFQLIAYATGLFIAILGRGAPVVGVFFWWAFSLLIARPSVAVSVRQLHDLGLSGEPLRRMMIMGVTQVAFWFGVILSKGQDRLVYGAAMSVSVIASLIAVGLFVMYCRRGQPGPNPYGVGPPAAPVVAP